MRRRTNVQARVGRQPAFWASGGFNTAEEALAEIEARRKEKEDTLGILAELAFAYEGALQYETLKRYPNREIKLLSDVMNKINKRKEDMINRSTKSGTMNTNDIGDFGGN